MPCLPFMKSYLNHTDEELVLLLKQNGSAVFEEIYNRYWEKLFNSAYKRIRDTELCEEIIQDVFTRFWQHHTEISFQTGLSNYLFTAVRYNVIDHYRKYAVRENFAAQKGDEHSEDSTQEAIYLKELKTQIDQSVNQLSEKCRVVYELSRLDHKTNKEIAVLLNIAEKTVEGHLTKALQNLRVHIKDYLLLLILFLLTGR